MIIQTGMRTDIPAFIPSGFLIGLEKAMCLCGIPIISSR